MHIVLLFLSLVVLTLTPGSVQGALHTFDDKAAFLTATAASSASGPLPDLGQVGGPTSVGSVTFWLAPGGNTLFIGANGTGVADWYPPTPGNDIALGFENLQVQTATPVFALGFDFVEPNLTMPDFGGTPVDSTFEVVLYAGTTEVGRFTFNAVDDELAFVGVWSDVPFDRVTIIDTTGDHDDEFFGEFYTSAVPPPCADAALCQVNNQNVFLAATDASAATGEDGNGNPLSLPDLGEIRGQEVTIGEVTLRSPQLAVGTRGIPNVVNNDWTTLLPGPDIALVGPGPVKRLRLDFAQPVYAAGFEYVEPQTGPNVGRRFSDATFTIELKDGNRTIRELTFNGVNDVPTFVGVWAEQAFTGMTIRSNPALGNKMFGKVFISKIPPLILLRTPLYVTDLDAGTNRQGALFKVDAVDGTRTILSDFGNPLQGQPGVNPLGVAVERNGTILVVDPDAGTNARGLLTRVDPTTGQRLPVHDFGTGPTATQGAFPVSVAVEANGNILVVDEDAGTNRRSALFRVNPSSGTRTLLHDFGTGPAATQGDHTAGVAVEANGNILVVDYAAGTDDRGALFRLTPGGGSRTLLSDFGTFAQGPLGLSPFGVAVEANGTIVVVDQNAGPNRAGILFRVNPQTGVRVPFGPLLADPYSVAVDRTGRILTVSPVIGLAPGVLYAVDPVTSAAQVLSNFENPAQGPLGIVPLGVAVRW